MKKTWIITALLTLAIGAPFAVAKKPKGEKGAASGVFVKYDKDGNGTLDDKEKETVKKAFATDPDLKKYDTDGKDGLSDNEIAAIKPEAMKKKKKKA